MSAARWVGVPLAVVALLVAALLAPVAPLMRMHAPRSISIPGAALAATPSAALPAGRRPAPRARGTLGSAASTLATRRWTSEVRGAAATHGGRHGAAVLSLAVAAGSFLLAAVARAVASAHQSPAAAIMAAAATSGAPGPLVGRRPAAAAALAGAGAVAARVPAARAAVPLPDCLYLLLRVKEATEQEARLISTGLYKDVQRANVKLAVRMLVENYRLDATFANAATYIVDPVKQAQARQIGRGATEALYTIQEYFDPARVENLSVGEELTGERRRLVLEGLKAVGARIDAFVAFLPAADVQAARALIDQENQQYERDFAA